MIVAFAILAVLIGVGITLWRDKTDQQRWGVIKTYAFAAMCAMLAGAILFVIVILF